MRAIAIAAGLFLIAVSSSCGSSGGGPPPGVTQSAVEITAPASAGKNVDPVRGVGLIAVLCPSATGCVGLGGYHALHGPHAREFAFTGRGGSWTPLDTFPPLLGIFDLTCPTLTSCVGVTNKGPGVSLLAQRGQSWLRTPLALPGSPADLETHISSISCGAPGECVAVGTYTAGRPKQGFLVTAHAGHWGRATFPAGQFSSASCASAGSCTLVGTRSQGKGGVLPWVMDESGRPHFLRLPADAGRKRDPRGTSPFMGFSGLSCASAGECTATGGYVDRHGDFQGVIFSERGGGWQTGIRAPRPADAVPWTDSNELSNPLGAVACSRPGDCVALGSYVKDDSGYPRATLLTERNGKWRANVPALPSSAPGGVHLSGLACPSRGECVVTGWWSSGHDTPGQYGFSTFGLVLLERKGVWEKGFRAAVPADAAGSAGSHTFLDAVVCASASRCLASGSYVDKAGASLKPGPPGPPQRAFLLTLRLG